MLENSPLERALAQLVAFLDQHRVPYMLVGGVANLVWGEPRLTQDVDATVSADPAELLAALEGAGGIFHVLSASPLDFMQETGVLPLATSEGVRLDLIPARLPFEHEAIQRAKEVELGKTRARVATPEDLVLLKIISERPLDRLDVLGVIRRQASDLDRDYLDPRVREMAILLERPEIQTFYDECLRQTPSGTQ